MCVTCLTKNDRKTSATYQLSDEWHKSNIIICLIEVHFVCNLELRAIHRLDNVIKSMKLKMLLSIWS